MSTKKIVSIVLLVVGVIVLFLSLIADLLGIGVHVGFGNYQILGTIAGVIVTVVGLVLIRRK